MVRSRKVHVPLFSMQLNIHTTKYPSPGPGAANCFFALVSWQGFLDFLLVQEGYNLFHMGFTQVKCRQNMQVVWHDGARSRDKLP